MSLQLFAHPARRPRLHLRRRVIMAKEQLLAKIATVTYDPDGDHEGTWVRHVDHRPVFDMMVSYTWRPPETTPETRCPSTELLFGLEQINCNKRRGHKGIHRNCETYGWDDD